MIEDPVIELQLTSLKPHWSHDGKMLPLHFSKCFYIHDTWKSGTVSYIGKCELYISKLWFLQIWKTRLSYFICKETNNFSIWIFAGPWMCSEYNLMKIPILSLHVHPLPRRTEVMLVWVMEVEVSWWRVQLDRAKNASHMGLEEFTWTCHVAILWAIG